MTHDPTTWRAQATSSLRWLVIHVRVARLAESRGDAHGARLAWLGAWRHAERRAGYEGRRDGA